MKKENAQLLLEILQHLNQDYTSLSHLAVNIRDKELYNAVINTENFSNPHTMTPIELAQELGYNEFFNDKAVIEQIDDNTVIFDDTIHKYVNFIQGYKKRRVKILLNYIISYSNKITIITINDSTFKRIKNRVVVKCLGRKHFFRDECEIMDRFYAFVTDRSLRQKYSISEVRKKYNVYLYSFLAKKISEHMNLSGLKNILDKLHEYVFNISCAEKNDKCLKGPLYKVYRNCLTMPTSSNYEPLSFLQRLCEPFMNIESLILDTSELELFRSVILFSISAFSIFSCRIKSYFEPLIHETFKLENKNFIICVEKSTPDVINLFYKRNNIIFVQSNNDCEFKINDYIIKYNYDQKKLDKHLNDFYNILNTTVKLSFYKTKVPIIRVQGCIEDTHTLYTMPHLTSKDELENYKKLYSSTLIYNGKNICGTVNDIFSTIINIRGEWADKIHFYDMRSPSTEYEWENNIQVYSSYYHFSIFTLQLNYMSSESFLKSDSRYREDIRLLEDGHVNECREAHEILMNRDKIKILGEEMIEGRLFNLVDNAWVYKGENIKKDEIEFKV